MVKDPKALSHLTLYAPEQEGGSATHGREARNASVSERAQMGRQRTDEWLTENFEQLGLEATVDIQTKYA